MAIVVPPDSNEDALCVYSATDTVIIKKTARFEDGKWRQVAVV